MAQTISICIVNYHTRNMILELLKTLPSSLGENRCELIIVDNSYDDFPSSLEKFSYPLKVIRNKTNLGFARACNQAMAASVGDYILILNPDTVLHEGAINYMVSYLLENPDVGIVAPKTLYPNGDPQTSTQRFPTAFTVLAHFLNIKRLLPSPGLRRWAGRYLSPILGSTIGYYLANYSRQDECRDVDWAAGSCLLVRREAYEQVGPMDEGYFMYMEDVDWCYRFHLKKWRIVYLPKAVVVHQVGGSASSFNIDVYASRYFGILRYFQKHKPKERYLIFIILTIGIISRLIAAMIAGRRGREARIRISANKMLIKKLIQAFRL